MDERERERHEDRRNERREDRRDERREDRNGEGAMHSAPDVSANIERAMRLIQPLATSTAAPDAMLITMTIAALMPVIQATMSFVLASSNTYSQMHTESATLAGTHMPLLAESARKILASSGREPAPVAQAMARETAYHASQPQTLAVT